MQREWSALFGMVRQALLIGGNVRSVNPLQNRHPGGEVPDVIEPHEEYE